MASLWITYAWADNEDRDVDLLSAELVRAGITVKLDRWNIPVGQRLWQHIAEFITNPLHSDGWAIYATQRSLGSEPCREELAYALDRAISARSDGYPVIALFPGSVDSSLLPPSLRSRLCVSTTDPDWKEKIASAVERRSPLITAGSVEPYAVHSHPVPPPFGCVIEARPRAGVWNPFIFAIPAEEKEKCGLMIRSGPPKRIPPIAGVVFDRGEGVTPDGKWFYCLGYEAASPTNSYYAFMKQAPSIFGFGEEKTPNLFFTFKGP